MAENGICKEHSGCMTDIANIKANMHELWNYTKGSQDEMKKELGETKKAVQKTRDTIQSRINYVLGGVTVACILMVINLIVGK